MATQEIVLEISISEALVLAPTLEQHVQLIQETEQVITIVDLQVLEFLLIEIPQGIADQEDIILPEAQDQIVLYIEVIADQVLVVACPEVVAVQEAACLEAAAVVLAEVDLEAEEEVEDNI